MTNKDQIITAVIENLKSKDYTPQAIEILKKSTESVLERLKSTLEISIKDAASPIIADFSKKTTEKLNNLSQRWVNTETAELEVFPEGTKYIHKNGKITTIVVEQPPHSRNIRYLEETYFLSFPYTQFTINFFEEKIESIYMSMTKKPITGLDGLLYFPCLPNINVDHKVCMGSIKNSSHEGSMSEKVKSIISTIWQSTFTADYSENFNFFLRSNFNGRPLTEWKEKTKENPLFIVGKDIKLKEGRTLKRFITNDSKNESAEVIATNMKNVILDSVTAIATDMKQSFSVVDIQEENIDKVHLETMQQILKEFAVLCYDVLWDYLQEDVKKEREKMKEEMKSVVSSMQEDFKNFLENPYK